MQGAPDCFEKNILVVNDVFQPEIRITKGHILEVMSKILHAVC